MTNVTKTFLGLILICTALSLGYFYYIEKSNSDATRVSLNTNMQDVEIASTSTESNETNLVQPAFNSDDEKMKFTILNANYVISNNQLIYLRDDVVGWLKDVHTSAEFEDFLANPPEQLSDLMHSDGSLTVPVLDFNLDSLTVVSDRGYVADKHHVFYAGAPFTDATSTFYVFGNMQVATDGKFVYCKNNVIQGAHPTSFRPARLVDLQNSDLSKFVGYDGFVDRGTFYYLNNYINTGECDSIVAFDIASFRNINETNYSFDKNHVYLYVSEVMTNEFLILPDADVPTFEVLGNGWSRDKNSLFYEAVKVENSYPGTFSFFESLPRSSSYAKDKGNVYFISVSCCKDGGGQLSTIEGADPTTFMQLGSNIEDLQRHLYAKDKSNIYKDDKKLIGVDYETFKVPQ